MTHGPIRHRQLSLPLGVPHDHLAPMRSSRFAAVDHRGRITALVAEGMTTDTAFGAMAVHHTATDDGTWDGPANEANLSNDDGATEYREAFAWVDPDKDADTKDAYSFIHHEVSSDGKVGAANETACSSTVGILNGGRGVNVKQAAWADDRQGIFNHVIAHLKDAGVKADDLPELDDMSVVVARDNAFANLLTQAIVDGQETTPEAVAVAVATMTTAELLEHFGEPGAKPAPTMRTRTTPVDAVDLAARIEQLRERQSHTPEIERMRVKLRGTEQWFEMAVRWDEESSSFVETATEQALIAAGADLPQLVDNPGAPWHAILCVEGLRTDEDPGREIMPDACKFPDLPVSLRLQIEDEGGHWGAVTCGRIDTMDRQDMEGYNAIGGTGVFSESENGQLAQLLVAEQTQRFISIDPRDVDMELVEVEVITQTSGVGGYYDYDDDDDCEPALYDWWIRYTNLTIGAATIVATPALQQAVIALADVPLPETPIAVLSAPPTTVTVTAAGNIAEPPAWLFNDPGFHDGDPRLVRQPEGAYACPLRVDRKSGHVFGHIAYWEAEHTGLPGRKVNPPHSPTYAKFMTGVRRTAEGELISVGNLTMGTGHASVSIRSADAAKAHYHPEVGAGHYDGGYGAVQMADVVAGEDKYGIWVSGVLCEGVTEDQIRKFESLGLSGDWRTIPGVGKCLVAVLAVPVPGFPIAREDVLTAAAEIVDSYAARAGIDEDGEVYALVAAGRVRPVPLEDRLARLEAVVDRLERTPQIDAALAELAELTS